MSHLRAAIDTEESDHRTVSTMEESKLAVNLLKRSIVPRLQGHEGERMTDDGRPYPSNDINSRKFTSNNFVLWIKIL